jgi:hypothetical protein
MGFLLEMLVENHIKEGVAEKERKRKRSEGDGKIKEVGVYLFCSFFSHPPTLLFVLLKKKKQLGFEEDDQVS